MPRRSLSLSSANSQRIKLQNHNHAYCPRCVIISLFRACQIKVTGQGLWDLMLFFFLGEGGGEETLFFENVSTVSVDASPKEFIPLVGKLMSLTKCCCSPGACKAPI